MDRCKIGISHMDQAHIEPVNLKIYLEPLENGSNKKPLLHMLVMHPKQNGYSLTLFMNPNLELKNQLIDMKYLKVN